MITHTDFASLIGTFESDSREWHAARRGRITGTDIGAILGVSPFKSTYTLWAEKRGLISDHIEPSLPMRLGSLFEAPIRQIFREQHPELVIHETGTWVHNIQNYLANPDGLIEYPDGTLGILEVKHTSQDWSELPETYFEQVHWYMALLGCQTTIVAAVTGGRYTEFEVSFDREHHLEVLRRVMTFEDMVKDNVAPDWDGSTSTYETVRTLSPGLIDGETELGHLWVNLSNAKQRYDEAETLFSSFKTATLAQMNGVKVGTYNGEPVVSLQARNGKPFLTFK